MEQLWRRLPSENCWHKTELDHPIFTIRISVSIKLHICAEMPLDIYINRNSFLGSRVTPVDPKVSIVCNCLLSGWNHVCIDILGEKNNKESNTLRFVRRMHMWQMDSPHKRPAIWKSLPVHDVIICWCMMTCNIMAIVTVCFTRTESNSDWYYHHLAQLWHTVVCLYRSDLTVAS